MSRAELATWLWRALAHCPPAAVYWASLAYRAGIEDGRQQLLDDLSQAGHQAARLARPAFNEPTHAELQRRRGAHHAPSTNTRSHVPAGRP